MFRRQTEAVVNKLSSSSLQQIQVLSYTTCSIFQVLLLCLNEFWKYAHKSDIFCLLCVMQAMLELSEQQDEVKKLAQSSLETLQEVIILLS